MCNMCKKFSKQEFVKKSNQIFVMVYLSLSFVILLAISVVKACNISEYECDNKECIQLDGYCNGVRQCRDGSDEKSGCSPCNRTYYGLETFTYKLSLHSSSLCTFTFIAAGGGRFGDIIQLSLPLIEPPSASSSSSSFSSNSFASAYAAAATTTTTISNCTSILTLSEPNQISKFCLSTSFNSSKVNYYSNSNKITVSFIHNIEIVYRFLPSVMLTKGVLLQGTICSILYENCSRSALPLSSKFSANGGYSKYGVNDKTMMISSGTATAGYSNYYYPSSSDLFSSSNTAHLDVNSILASGSNDCLVRSPNYPGIIASNVSCYYAFRENTGSLIHIQGSVRLSNDCESYLVVYDGYSIRDRILGKYCGDMAVDVISGGNEMLVEFYSGKNGLWKSRGLQLEATSISSTLTTPCQTTISSLISMSGTLATPLSTLANSTFTSSSSLSSSSPSFSSSSSSASSCTYNFQGTSKQLIWFMFQQFDSSNGGELIFTDGAKSIVFTNSTPPPLCELLYLPFHRPCKQEEESILSKTNAVTIALQLPKPLFKLQYVFIEPSNCQKFHSQPNGHLASTRNLFDFGAGGAKQLRCGYEFNENTRLVIKDAAFEGNCKMIFDEITSRTKCKYGTSKRAQHTRLEYYQIVNTTSVLKQCFCGTKLRLPIILTSNYKSKLLLVGVNMGRDISPENSFFTGSYSKLATPPCTSTHFLQVSTKTNYPFYSNCETFLLLLPKPSIYIKLEGCAIVHTDYDFNYMCNNELFSPGFKNSTLSNNIYIELTNYLTINFVQVFNPLEPNYNYVSSDPYHLIGGGGVGSVSGGGSAEELSEDTCGGFKCTSINACISKELFCNGNANCPNAEDESCSVIDYTYLYAFIVVVLLGGFILLLCTGVRRTRVIRKGVG